LLGGGGGPLYFLKNFGPRGGGGPPPRPTKGPFFVRPPFFFRCLFFPKKNFKFWGVFKEILGGAPLLIFLKI
jgi:hypothetical protein